MASCCECTFRGGAVHFRPIRGSVGSAVVVATFLLMILVIAACAVDQALPNRTPPEYSIILDAQRERLAKLESLKSGGVIELNWKDAGGRSRYEQGDITLLLGLPNQLALRIHKLGDTFMWIGSDENRFWLFDLHDSEGSVAYIGRHQDFQPGEEIPGVIHPMRLVDLLGLGPLPAEATVDYDEEARAWRVDAAGRGGPIRIFFDPDRYWPIRVDALAPDGSIRYQSRLTRYAAIEAQGMTQAAFPRMAKRIEIREINESTRTVVTLDQPTTIVRVDQIERATDLDRLIESMHPDRIETLTPQNR